MLPLLCEKVDSPIFIVQHMPPTFTLSLAKSLNDKCRHTVLEAENNDMVQDRHVYIAPGGRHMLIQMMHGEIRTVVNDQPPENGCKPSVNKLFRSAAAVYGRNAIAIVLTGMGADGTEGAEHLKQAGAFIIAQDEETSTVWGMPRSVAASGHAHRVLPLDSIPYAVISRCSQSGGGPQ